MPVVPSNVMFICPASTSVVACDGGLVGDENDIGAGDVLEHFAAQMRRRADHGAVIQFAGMALA